MWLLSVWNSHLLSFEDPNVGEAASERLEEKLRCCRNQRRSQDLREQRVVWNQRSHVCCKHFCFLNRQQWNLKWVFTNSLCYTVNTKLMTIIRTLRGSFCSLFAEPLRLHWKLQQPPSRQHIYRPQRKLQRQWPRCDESMHSLKLHVLLLTVKHERFRCNCCAVSTVHLIISYICICY